LKTPWFLFVIFHLLWAAIFWAVVICFLLIFPECLALLHQSTFPAGKVERVRGTRQQAETQRKQSKTKQKQYKHQKKR
jgi:hypothetical protein